jgi:D-arabinose 1-dehydrogenase-like Zn-dependent alcohol dehydrogenase
LQALDTEETVQFADNNGVNCLAEKFPLDNVEEAIERMTSNKVRFRSVLVMD